MASVRGQPGILQSESRAVGVPLFHLEGRLHGCHPPATASPAFQVWEVVTSEPGCEGPQRPIPRSPEAPSEVVGGGQPSGSREALNIWP